MTDTLVITHQVTSSCRSPSRTRCRRGLATPATGWCCCRRSHWPASHRALSRARRRPARRQRQDLPRDRDAADSLSSSDRARPERTTLGRPRRAALDRSSRLRRRPRVSRAARTRRPPHARGRTHREPDAPAAAGPGRAPASRGCATSRSRGTYAIDRVDPRERGRRHRSLRCRSFWERGAPGPGPLRLAPQPPPGRLTHEIGHVFAGHQVAEISVHRCLLRAPQRCPPRRFRDALSTGRR
jgi:hypothetical protein